MSDHIADAGKMVHAAKLADALEEHPKGAAMTNDAQRIAMAELEGWRFWQNAHGAWCVTSPSGGVISLPGTPEQAILPSIGRDFLAPHGLDNHLKDLNAVRRVEEKLTDEEHDRYRTELMSIVCRDGKCSPLSKEARRAFISASAAQKTEAILRATRKYTP